MDMMMGMTRAQRLALKNPCRLAVEVSSPLFTHRDKTKTVRLTVNTGWE